SGFESLAAHRRVGEVCPRKAWACLAGLFFWGCNPQTPPGRAPPPGPPETPPRAPSGAPAPQPLQPRAHNRRGNTSTQPHPPATHAWACLTGSFFLGGATPRPRPEGLRPPDPPKHHPVPPPDRKSVV